jgi:metallo-beta-lactamase class B
LNGGLAPRLIGKKEKVMKPRQSFWRLIGLLAGMVLAVGCTKNQVGPVSTPTVEAATPRPIVTQPAKVQAVTATPVAFTHIDLSEGLYLRQIRKEVFVVTHAFPWPANSLIVEMTNSDLVLVGTPYTPAAMTEVLNWIAGRFGHRKIIAINPGYHVDNLGGNSALIEHGITVYGSDLTAQLLKERGEQTRQVMLGMLTGVANERYYKAQAEIPYVAPSQLFPIAQGLKLSFGEDELEVYYPGPSQAPDKVVAYFPGQKVLFGSCMILGGDQIGNTSDADLKNWPEAVRKLKQFDAEVVVPGHGDRLDAGLIEHTIALLTAQP